MRSFESDDRLIRRYYDIMSLFYGGAMKLGDEEQLAMGRKWLAENQVAPFSPREIFRLLPHYTRTGDLVKVLHRYITNLGQLPDPHTSFVPTRNTHVMVVVGRKTPTGHYEAGSVNGYWADSSTMDFQIDTRTRYPLYPEDPIKWVAYTRDFERLMPPAGP